MSMSIVVILVAVGALIALLVAAPAAPVRSNAPRRGVQSRRLRTIPPQRGGHRRSAH
ncbi:hypothetical protein [Streptomyces sp. WM4235]|uniref:hypothetical protein n=1 Tax=Streptomyces sp. WM4235 TaxID=1415551 RepID=UPI000B1347D4|nr:hypothetical protein [Streptomyces sp. WM4235]